MIDGDEEGLLAMMMQCLIPFEGFAKLLLLNLENVVSKRQHPLAFALRDLFK